MTDANDTDSSALLFSIGAPIDRCKVSLRIFGDDLDPDEISRILLCEPSSKTKKGEIVADDGKGNQRISPHGSWRLELAENDELGLEEQVLKLLSSVTADSAVWRRLTVQYKVDLFCGVFLNAGSWNRGFSLSPKVLKELAERNLEIGFDIYAS